MGGRSEHQRLRGSAGARPRSAACQELANTGTNTVDRATQPGRKVGADLYLWDAVEHWLTLPCSLGVKWSQVQILSARRCLCRSGMCLTAVIDWVVSIT
jgi:hypothetical protein